MFTLTKEQKLANLKETYKAKYQKFSNLQKELVDLKKKIEKLEKTTTVASNAPATPVNQIPVTSFFSDKQK